MISVTNENGAIQYEFDMNAPIALFVYNRLTQTQHTIESLRNNSLAQVSDLIIFSDGPKKNGDQDAVNDVRKYIDHVKGFQSVTVYKSQENKGLAQSIIFGITKVLSQYDRIIVLEDDMVTSPSFLDFMNQGLELYKNEESVISIHGYMYPIKGLPDFFFLKGAHCWGWATWRRGWELFQCDSKVLLAEIIDKKLNEEFDYKNAYPFTKMLADQINGLNDSWAIRWHASAFLLNKLTLYPSRSFVKNIGFDDSGVHSTMYDKVYDVVLREDHVDLTKISIEENLHARTLFSKFFKSIRLSLIKRIVYKIMRLLK